MRYKHIEGKLKTDKNEESSSEGPRIFVSMLVFVPFDLLGNPLKGTTSNYFFAECGLLHTAVHVSCFCLQYTSLYSTRGQALTSFTDAARLALGPRHVFRDAWLQR